jgi:hypothetical protein
VNGHRSLLTSERSLVNTYYLAFPSVHLLLDIYHFASISGSMTMSGKKPKFQVAGYFCSIVGLVIVLNWSYRSCDRSQLVLLGLR